VYFSIRDDDTSFFTSPEELEQAYGKITQWGPVSLAIIPFCQAGGSKGVPAAYRGQWSIHPLDRNEALVEYLRQGIAKGRYEAMLHGYNHDLPDVRWEFMHGAELTRKVREGKQYLEELLRTTVRVFVPPHNAIGKSGLEAIAQAGLHLGGVAGMRRGWSWSSIRSVRAWWQMRRRRAKGLEGVPSVLELDDHRELAGNPITPMARLESSLKRFDEACAVRGSFCAATHYWEFGQTTGDPLAPTVEAHLQKLIQRALADSRVRWVSVGTAIVDSTPTARLSSGLVNEGSGIGCY